jgi:enoyl-CoA hydratase/carnithine racemase
VLETLDDGVLTLMLNRPEKRNALDTATLDALHAGVERADLEASARVLAIRGQGRTSAPARTR